MRGTEGSWHAPRSPAAGRHLETSSGWPPSSPGPARTVRRGVRECAAGCPRAAPLRAAGRGCWDLQQGPLARNSSSAARSSAVPPARLRAARVRRAARHRLPRAPPRRPAGAPRGRARRSPRVPGYPRSAGYRSAR